MRKQSGNSSWKPFALEGASTEGERRFKLLADSLPQNVWISKPDGSVAYCNQRWIDYTGVSQEQLQDWNWTHSLHPDDLERCLACWKGCIESGEDYEIEYRWRRGSDGSYRWHLGRAVAVSDIQGNIVEWVGTMTDIEAEKQAEIAAEQANRAKSDFLSSMSHELRTPLNAILGYAQILLREPSLDEGFRTSVEVIRTSGELLLTLINDLLDIAKIEAGKQELSLSDIPLMDFLRKIAGIIEIKAQQKGLAFVCEPSTDLPGGIRADENRLRQVLLNLLANAVKFTDRGSVRLRVDWRPSGRIRFEVQDSGTGIHRDQLARIFEPFEQGGEAKQRMGGTGLGLAISQAFVRLMGSDIQVESHPGRGSTFRFELEVPMVAAEAPPAPPGDKCVTGYKGPRKKLLIVDDVARNRALLVEMLSPLGFELLEAANGAEALDQVQRLAPDLVLMDLVLPEMDGFETTRRLHGIPGLQSVPVIAVTASAAGGDRKASKAAGMDAFLAKPIHLDNLLKQIAELLKLDWIHDGPREDVAAPPETVAPLILPSVREMQVLLGLAREGCMRDIAQYATQLARRDVRYRPFADELCKLAKSYQSKAILNLVERHLAQAPES